MVVPQDAGRGSVLNRRLQHLAPMHTGTVHRALEQLFERDQMVAIVEVEAIEQLMIEPTEVQFEVLPGARGRIHYRRAGTIPAGNESLGAVDHVLRRGFVKA